MQHANLIYLVDRVDALAARYRGHRSDGALLLHTDEIRRTVAGHRDRFFASNLVDAFLECSRSEAFWLRLEPEYATAYVDDMERQRHERLCTLAELKQFALIVARVVDAKSPFTAEHSLGVARLARFLGEELGLVGEHLDKLEIAALLHDIGKLQVPDELLESPQAFSADERAAMKKHCFATHQILSDIGGFRELALWAGAHHESLDGNGYPFHLAAAEIPLEARIIKVADVYQALAQRRPYRAPLAASQILAMLREMEAVRSIDGRVVAVVARRLDACQLKANGGEFLSEWRQAWPR